MLILLFIFFYLIFLYFRGNRKEKTKEISLDDDETLIEQKNTKIDELSRLGEDYNTSFSLKKNDITNKISELNIEINKLNIEIRELDDKINKLNIEIRELDNEMDQSKKLIHKEAESQKQRIITNIKEKEVELQQKNNILKNTIDKKRIKTKSQELLKSWIEKEIYKEKNDYILNFDFDKYNNFEQKTKECKQIYFENNLEKEQPIEKIIIEVEKLENRLNIDLFTKIFLTKQRDLLKLYKKVDKLLQKNKKKLNPFDMEYIQFKLDKIQTEEYILQIEQFVKTIEYYFKTFDKFIELFKQIYPKNTSKISEIIMNNKMKEKFQNCVIDLSKFDDFEKHQIDINNYIKNQNGVLFDQIIQESCNDNFMKEIMISKK